MTNEFKGRTGIDRLIRAAGYSASGLRMAYVGERAFRQEVWLAVLMLPATFWLGNDVGSAAVLLSLLLCGGIWLTALNQRVPHWF